MRYVRFYFVLSFALLAGCAHQNTLAALPNAAPAVQTRSATPALFQVLYSFKGPTADGRRPVAPVLSGGGEFWGTTEYGGANDSGTVFELKSDGTERVVHSFKGGSSDGGAPAAGLLSYNGAYYGVTKNGGTANRGVLFELKGGTYKVIYSFAQSTGANPDGDLIAAGGVFYGTTLRGGAHHLGTVYSVTPTGHEKVLYSFAGGEDGANPMGALVKLGNNFYGTTYSGGGKNKGTVFGVTSSGKESVLHTFKGQGFQDGSNPAAGLVVLNNALYGTTELGGLGCCGSVFQLQTNGNESLVYSFNNSSGNTPTAGLTVYNGTLYGTAALGGAYSFGTVFKVKTDGTFTVLHSFLGKDGSQPAANVIVHNGKVYGTTVTGGSHSHGVVYDASP